LTYPHSCGDSYVVLLKANGGAVEGPLVVDGARSVVGDASVTNVVEGAAVHEIASIGAVCRRAKMHRRAGHVMGEMRAVLS
jgi:hypothetical protein